MVNKERVELLCQALESGKFEQCKGFMHRKVEGRNYYCCLGVACEVAIRNGVSLEVGESDKLFGETSVTYDDAEYSLPLRVMKWYGFSHQNPYLSSSKPDASAADMNDRGIPFLKISKAFRETYLNRD